MIGLYYCTWCCKTKHGKHVHEWLIIGKPVCKYTSCAAMFCPLHSSASIEQHKKHLCNSSSHYVKYGRFTREARAPYFNGESHNSSISAISNSISKHYSCEKCLSNICVWHWSHYVLTANCHLYVVVKKKWGHKGSTMIQHCSCCGWWKGTFWDKVTLINEEIKSLALAILELCCSDGISIK